MQRLLQQVDEARQLSLLLFCSRMLLLLGSIAPAPGTVHIVIGIADLTGSVVFATFGVRNATHYVLYSFVQFDEHLRGTWRKFNSFLAVRWRMAAILRPHVVGTPLFDRSFFGTSFVGPSFFRAAIRTLCNMFGLCSMSR
ncbi:MAG: hypothetical protein WB760_31290 [Xanthobacteraceae bacterium]